MRRSESKAFNDSPEPIRRIEGTELEVILYRAEVLLEASREAHRHAENIYIGLVTFGVGIVGSIAGSIVFVLFSESIIGLTTFVTLLASMMGFWRTARRRRRAERDATQRMEIAVELAALVEETYQVVAEEEQWSYVRVEATRKRLYMFPLAHRFDTQ